ncbi:hypothetical protein F0U62_10025 [Cystobacter fuscus]|uniref:hypothetical protein n=1 Tax=Cystobacter fuscus TaxID=43 RepID=UPI002B320A73|nr:hypothetical protein F0U62_10025 [Cystobacter fuscus]
MAEQFESNEGVVHFSNGAVESLYRAWSSLGRELARTSEQASVVDWLQAKLVRGGAGGRAFSLNPPPPELNSEPRLVFLAGLVTETALRIARNEPEFLPEIEWDDDLRASWLARLMDLHELLRKALPAWCAPPSMNDQFTLPPGLQAECKLKRLLSRLQAKSLPHPSEPHERLGLIEEALSTIRDHRLESTNAGALTYLFLERAELLLERGNAHEAVSALKDAASSEKDPQLRGDIETQIAKLERELRDRPY